MGLFTRDRPAPPRRGAIVASGKAIAVDDREQITRFRARTSQDYWQARAGIYNDSLPILGFCHDYVRDALSRVRPIAAIESEDPQAPPVPLSKDTAPDGLDPELCDQILQRLAPFPEYMGSVAFRLDVYGECYVAMIEDDVDGDGEEHCRVFSPLEVYVQGEQWRWKRDAVDQLGVPFKPGAPFWRIWQSSHSYSVLPYSHMIRLLLPSEELLLLSQLVSSIATSRIATIGKLVVIADEFSLESATADGQSSTEDAGDGEALSDTFFEDLFAMMTAAINNPKSAAAMTPPIIRGPHDLVKDGINVVDISRTFEETLLKLRQEAREEIATGVNLPREIPLGVGSTNHWNAEAIKEETWLNHLEPRAMAVTSSTTTAFYRPALLANGVDPAIVRRCVVGYDPTWFLGTPDRADGADEGLKDYAISLSTWREAKGYNEDDKPTNEEIQMRIGWKQQELVRTTIREDGGIGTEVQVVNPETNPAQVPKGDTAAPKGATVKVPSATDASAPAADGKPPAKPPLVAAGPPSKLDRLGPKLVAIERDLRTKLHAQTEAAVARALERAGMKARNQVQRLADKSSRVVRDQHKALLNQISAVPLDGVVAALGETTLTSYGLNEEQLLQGALGTLEPKYHQLVLRAQLAAARAAAEASGQDIDEDQLDQATKDARTAGWAVLATGILALARDLLYNPHPEAPTVGEFDESTVVPIGLVRAALDRAGGAQVGDVGRGGVVPATVPNQSTGPGGPPGALGATTGPILLDEFKQQLGIVDDHYEWVYGDEPRREFPPHFDLDTQTFTSWDDPVLDNPGDWPPNPSLFPNDHDNCQCSVAVHWSQLDDAAPPEDLS